MADETRDDRTTPEAEGGEQSAEEQGGGAAEGTAAEQPPRAAADAPSASSESETPDAASEGGEEESAGAAEDAAAEEEAAAKAAAEAKAKAEAAAKAKAEAEAKRAAEEAAKDPWERDPQDPEWIDEAADPLAEALAASCPEAIVSARSFAGELTFEIERERILEVAESLKQRHGYLLPVDICGAHYPDREEGVFEVVYHLYNFDTNRRIRLRVRTDEDHPVPSVTSVWRAANWFEREAYDMYGVRFSDHPDMTRILLWEGFNGYPLRKDFPVEGIDTGTAIYPEYYDEAAGPITGTGTGWKAPQPPEPEPEEEAAEDTPADN